MRTEMIQESVEGWVECYCSTIENNGNKNMLMILWSFPNDSPQFPVFITQLASTTTPNKDILLHQLQG
jgi:hypothetical protein